MSRDPIRAFKVPNYAIIADNSNHFSSSSLLPSSRLKHGLCKNSSTFESININGGVVFRFIGLYEDVSSFLVANNKRKAYSLRCKKMAFNGPEHGPRYAKCVSFASHPAGEVVFIPITETGR